MILNTADYPDPQSSIGPDVLRMTSDLNSYIVARGDALGVVSFNSLAIEPLNQMFHNGFPKFRSIPERHAARREPLVHVLTAARRRAKSNVSSPIRRT